MKPRYLIPWIPFIGLVYVLFISALVYKKYEKFGETYIKYTWGSDWAYWITTVAQGFGMSYILIYFNLI